MEGVLDYLILISCWFGFPSCPSFVIWLNIRFWSGKFEVHHGIMGVIDWCVCVLNFVLIMKGLNLCGILFKNCRFYCFFRKITHWEEESIQESVLKKKLIEWERIEWGFVPYFFISADLVVVMVVLLDKCTLIFI